MKIPAMYYWVYGYSYLRGQAGKNGEPRLLYKGGYSHGICEAFCGSYLPTT